MSESSYLGDSIVSNHEKKDNAHWQRIKDSFDPNSFEEFLACFPDSRYASKACLKAKTCIRCCNDWTQIERLLRDYEYSERAPLALSRLKELDLNRIKIDTSFAYPALRKVSPNRLALGFVGAVVSVAAYYIAFPSHEPLPAASPKAPGTERQAAKLQYGSNTSLDNKDFRSTKQMGTKEAFEGQLLQNPQGLQTGEARSALAETDDKVLGAERMGSIKGYRDYLDGRPEGRDAAAARIEISDSEARLADDRDFEAAKNNGTKEALEGYLATYAKGLHIGDAHYALAQLDTAAYQSATKLNSVDAFRNYLKDWPEGSHKIAAELHLSEVESAQLNDSHEFTAAKTNGTKSALETYLAYHPEGPHAQEAREKLDELEAIAFQSTERANTEQAYQNYLTAWPNGRHSTTANLRFSEIKAAQLADDQSFVLSKEKAKKEALEGYLTSYPHGLHAEEAIARLHELEATAYEAAERSNTEQAYLEYLTAWPDGRYKAAAGRKIAEIKATRSADDQAFALSTEKGTKEAIESYLAAYPGGIHAQEARAILTNLETAAFRQAAQLHAYRDFLQKLRSRALATEDARNSQKNRASQKKNGEPAGSRAETNKQKGAQKVSGVVRPQRGHLSARHRPRAEAHRFGAWDTHSSPITTAEPFIGASSPR